MKVTLKQFTEKIKQYQYYPCFSDLLDLIWLSEGTSFQELSLYNFRNFTENDFKDIFFRNKMLKTFLYAGRNCDVDKDLDEKVDKTIQFSNPRFDEDPKNVRYPGPNKFPINDLSYNDNTRIRVLEPIKLPIVGLVNIRQVRATCSKILEIKSIYGLKKTEKLEFIDSKGNTFLSI